MTSTRRIPKQQAFALPPPPLPESEADVAYGEFFTLPWVVDLILDLAGFDETTDLAAKKLVEPACGEGAFLRPIARRLIRSCLAHDRPLSDVIDSVVAYDLQQKNVFKARNAVVEEFQSAGMARIDAQAIAEVWVHRGDFLLIPHKVDSADFVIGNPPYVRLEDVGEERMALYRHACRTMTGRADIYVGFFELGLEILREDGVLGFICADRWMRNAYGRKLRALVSSGYAVEVAIEMHDVRAFATEVSAYPAVTIIRRAAQAPVVVTMTTAGFGPEEATYLTDWVGSRPATGATSKLPSDTHSVALSGWYEGGAPWPTGSPERLALLRDLESRFQPLEHNGTRIGIGVATGADQVFITEDPSKVESDCLLPLVLTKDTVSGELQWSGNYLINPWRPDGGLRDLNDHPRLGAYLRSHSDRLSSRHVATKRPTQWYRTIDPVRASLTPLPKLLFPDMKKTSHPVLDPGGHYPHHNLYHVTSNAWDLEVLGGLLLSRVAQLFVESYAVRMRGGTLRFQAQYLRRIRVPSPAELSRSTAEGLRLAFRARDVTGATELALAVYGINVLPD